MRWLCAEKTVRYHKNLSISLVKLTMNNNNHLYFNIAKSTSKPAAMSGHVYSFPECWRVASIIGSDNGLSPDRHHAIIWTNAGILLIGQLEIYFSDILSNICIFHSRKCIWKCFAVEWWPFCLGLNVLTALRVHISGYGTLINKPMALAQKSRINRWVKMTTEHNEPLLVGV